MSAPLRRSDTTLVQRLLCPSNNTLIYGKNCASELQTMVDLHLFAESTILSTGSEREKKINAIFSGDTNNWILGLMTSSKAWLAKIEESCFTSIVYLQEYAQLEI